jgi:histidinol-phosphatase (PHP family)
VLGFSDHTPYLFPHGYVSYFRMEPHQAEDYFQTIWDLKQEYAGEIQILLGVEAEYYPCSWPELLPRLQDAGIEYLLLGQHFVGNEINEHYSGKATGDESILERYCTQTCDAMQTGLFTYLAHPDLIHFRGDERTYRKHMRLICTEAKRCGIPLEVNMLGKMLDRNYPNPVFWELAAEEGCDVILGCDAHAPEHLLREDTERQLLAMIRSYGLNLLETVPLRKIK